MALPTSLNPGWKAEGNGRLSAPVIAGGGITTGRHLAGAITLGAAGVWTGTVWLASRESDLNQPLKERLIEVETEDAVFSDCISGYTMRTTRSPMTYLPMVWPLSR